MFLISAFNRGGAQRQLTLLVKAIDRTRFAVSVVTICDGGAFRPEIEHLEGVQIFSLRKTNRWGIPAALWRFWKILRHAKPQIVHGYLDVANMLALVLGKPAGAKVVWGLRSSSVDYSVYGRRPELYFQAAARFSRFADLIIANSQAGKQSSITSGFISENMLVIPNGFDTDRFRPDPEAGRRMRREWGIGDHERVIGIVARLDPMKDHRTFLRAAALLAAERCDVRFVCAGDGRDAFRQELQAFGEALGLDDRLVWAGEMANMPAVHNALDIATLTTANGEGFSNAIGEAMACGIPCVVTDVGDSALIVGKTGLVVPPEDPDALFAAWKILLDMPSDRRTALGLAARNRILSEFSVQQLTRRTEEALAQLVSDAG